MKYHLGLDISTSCTGWAVLSVDDSSEVVSARLGHISLKAFPDLITKSHEALRSIEAICCDYDLDQIFIEENLQAFRPGASSADTLLKLAKINGVITFLCHQVTGITPRAVNVIKARKALGITVKRQKLCGVKTKDQVHNWVKSHSLMREYSWPTKILKSGPRKGKEILHTYAYDMADAFVVALAGPIVPV